MTRILRLCFVLLVVSAFAACIERKPILGPDEATLDKKPEKRCTDYASGNVAAVGSTALPVHDAADIAAAGSYAYLALGNAGVAIINADKPNHPKIVGSVAVDARHITLADDRVLVTGTTGLHVIDASDPSAPSVVGSLNRKLGAGLAASGDFAYVSSIDHDATSGEDNDSLLIVDIGDPSTPRIVWRELLTIGGVVHNLSLSRSGPFLFVAAGYNDADRVSTRNVSNPNAPTHSLGGANILLPLLWCAVTETHAYYAAVDPPFVSVLAYGIGADGDMTGGGPDHNTYVQGMNPVCGAVCVLDNYVFSAGSCLSVTDAVTLERVGEIELPATVTPKAIAAGASFVYIAGDAFDVYPAQCARGGI
jgi:hypothetical protein